jgi:hypothetical protein
MIKVKPQHNDFYIKAFNSIRIPLKDGNWTAIFVYDKKSFGLKRRGCVVQRDYEYYFGSYEEIVSWVNEDYEKQKAKRW